MTLLVPESTSPSDKKRLSALNKSIQEHVARLDENEQSLYASAVRVVSWIDHFARPVYNLGDNSEANQHRKHREQQRIAAWQNWVESQDSVIDE